MFAFHSWLGWFALAGSVIVFLLAVLNQRQTQRPQAEAARLGAWLLRYLRQIDHASPSGNFHYD